MITEMSSCPQVLCIRWCWQDYIRLRIISEMSPCPQLLCWKEVHPVEDIGKSPENHLGVVEFGDSGRCVRPQNRACASSQREADNITSSFIAFGRSSGLHLVSSRSCCMYIRAGRPTFAWPYAGVHRSTSLMSSFLLLQQCPACLVRLTCIVFVMGGKWLYSWCLVGCCRQDLFKIALNILV